MIMTVVFNIECNKKISEEFMAMSEPALLSFDANDRDKWSKGCGSGIDERVSLGLLRRDRHRGGKTQRE